MSIKRKMKRSSRNVKKEEYLVYYGSMRDEWEGRVPDEVLSAMDELYQMTRRDPKRAIPRLEEWVGAEPDALPFREFLFMAHMNAGDPARAEEVLNETLRLHPTCLSARISMAEILFRRGDPDGFEKVFGDAWTLRQAYPGRKRFHVSEFTGFHVLLGFYCLRRGDRKCAEAKYELLRSVAPDEQPTRALGRALAGSPGLLGRLSAILGLR